MDEGLTVKTTSPSATRTVAAAVAAETRRGDLLILSGDLGAGKTVFTKGLAEALGVDETVTSPTFTLLRSYATKRSFTLHHVDAYRLDRFAELDDLGLRELLDDGDVVVVEWGDAVAERLSDDYLHVHISFGPGDDDRVVEVVASGGRWSMRVGALSGRLGC